MSLVSKARIYDSVELLLFEEGMVQHLTYTFLVFPEKQHHRLKLTTESFF